ncbi:MAG: iron complex outermembrane receptor protein [Paraglaciecola sp.]|jgi:iron complex outermembrane receptor protein
MCFFAMPANADNAASSTQEDNIEIIEVNAQKRPQDIRDVAMSLNLVDGQTIIERQLKDTTALSAIAPNFKITQNAAEGTPPAVNIRGVGSVDYNTSTQSPVGIYLDGAASASANSQLVNLFDVESVEILRGPQGTLFGRNTTGGAILINSVSAKMDNSGYFNLGYAQRNHLSVEGAMNRHINANIAARFAFSHQDYEYSTNNLAPNTPQAQMRQTHGRLSISGQWNKLTIDTKIYLSKWNGIVNPVGSIGVIKSFDPATGLPASFCSPSAAGSAACTDAFGFNDGSNDFHDVAVNNNISGNSPHKTDSHGINVEARYEFNENNYLVSLSNFSTLDREHYFNSDGSPASLGEGNQNVGTDTFSQELRLHQEIGDIYLITGLYFLNEELKQDNRFDLLRDFRAVEGLFGNAVTFLYDNTIEIQSSALFAHIEYPLSKQTTFSAGLRYSDESTDYNAIGQINIATFANDQSGLTVPSWDASGKINDSNLSGKLALLHKFNAENSGFVSFSRGFKSGGYNGALISSAAEAQNNDYGAETLNAYEIGLHSQLSQSIRLYSAAFYYDYQDQQVFMNQSAVTLGAPPLQLLSNVGESAIYGAEFDLNAQLTSALSTKFSIGYLPEAHLVSFVDASGVEIKDNRLPFTSKWNVAAQADYLVELNSGQLNFHIDADYQSTFYFDQNQSPFAIQKGYLLWNARVAWEKANWTIGAWVKNLTNEEYSHLKFDLVNLFGMLQDFKGEARQVGLDLHYDF